MDEKKVCYLTQEYKKGATWIYCLNLANSIEQMGKWKTYIIACPYEDIVTRWFQLEITAAIIATMDKKPAGFAMIGDISNRWNLPHISELLAIAVEPEKQGRGIGEILISEIERKALERNIKRIFLHTAVNNLSARKLFTKNGYRIWEIKRDFYPKGQDAMMMSKEIWKSPGKSR